MNDHDSPFLSPSESPSGFPSVVLGVLYGVAAVTVLAGLILSAWWLTLQGEQAPAARGLWLSILVLSGGMVAGCLLWAAASVIRQQQRILRLLKDRPTEKIDVSCVATPSEGVSLEAVRVGLNSIVEELREVNANLLMTDVQRDALREAQASVRGQELFEQITRAIEANDFLQAEKLRCELELDRPDDARLASVASKIQQGFESQRLAHIEGRLQQANDLMSVLRFGEAAAVAETLQQEFPDSDEAKGLLSRVQREAATFEAEQRGRLVALIQEHAEARQWPAALEAAHRLLERYPESPDAEKTREMLPTLVDNTRIAEVREFRDRFVSMLDRRQYADAIKVAEYVTENYPETTAAAEFREQMPRLRDLATRPPA